MRSIALVALMAASLSACVVAVPSTPTSGSLHALQLNSVQQTNVRTLMGLNTSSPFTVQVLDKDNNSKLNAGDIAVMSGGITRGEVSRRVLNQADVNRINSVPQPPPPNGTAAFLRNLDQAEATWRQKRPKHYAYTLQRTCFCTPESRKPIQIRVYEGVTQQAIVLPEGYALPKARWEEAKTIDQLFRLIREAVDRQAASMEVQYDPNFGFPTYIAIDYDSMMADEEVYYEASDFKVASSLKPRQPRR